MMKKLLVTLLEIALIALVIYAIITALNGVSFADELTEAYVICQPKDYIHVRIKPSKRSQAVGYAEAGDRIITDGEVRNGYLRCYGIGENGEGWIHTGYIVYDEPVTVNRMGYAISNGKLAARKYIGGKVRKWLKNMDGVMVYMVSEEWCVTSSGFIRTEYLEMEGE